MSMKQGSSTQSIRRALVLARLSIVPSTDCWQPLVGPQCFLLCPYTYPMIIAFLDAQGLPQSMNAKGSAHDSPLTNLKYTWGLLLPY